MMNVKRDASVHDRLVCRRPSAEGGENNYFRRSFELDGVWRLPSTATVSDVAARKIGADNTTVRAISAHHLAAFFCDQADSGPSYLYRAARRCVSWPLHWVLLRVSLLILY